MPSLKWTKFPAAWNFWQNFRWKILSKSLMVFDVFQKCRAISKIMFFYNDKISELGAQAPQAQNTWCMLQLVYLGNCTRKLPIVLNRRLYSPSLKDVTWLNAVNYFLYIFHTFVCKFGRVEGAAREKKLETKFFKLGE